MNNSTPKSLLKMGQIMLEGVREIIGEPGVNAVLNTVEAGSGADMSGLESGSRIGSSALRQMTATGEAFNEMSTIQMALEQLYGPRGGRGISLRSGRAAFKYFLRQYGDSMGISRLEYRLLPTHSRMKVGMQAMAAIFTDQYAGYAEVSEDTKSWTWQIRRCPWCLERKLEEKDLGGGLCYFVVGMLQEFLSWSSGGKNYHVEETECIAAGGQACVIRIEKQPLD
jgi:predicted hydrocarbon binding protein